METLFIEQLIAQAPIVAILIYIMWRQEGRMERIIKHLEACLKAHEDLLKDIRLASRLDKHT